MTTTICVLLTVAVSVLAGQAAASTVDFMGTALAHQEACEQTIGPGNASVVGAAMDPGGSARAMAGGDEVFSDDFDDGDISDWTVVTTEDALFDVSSARYVSPPYSVHMQSTGNGKATGVSPTYSLDLSRKYKVSFSFLVPHANNHWFEVFNNHQIYLVIDQGTDLKGYKPSLRTVYPIATLDADEWYLVEVRADPAGDTYDVYLDGQFEVTCPMWVHSGGETDFRIGDRADGSTDRGEAYWDDLEITQGARGDLNCDGSINGLDIDPFVLALTSTPPGYAEYYAEQPDCDVFSADCNEDGSINGLDIDPFVALLVGG